MFRIRELKAIVPIKIDEYTLRLMNHNDVQWYANNIKSDYFLNYMDNKAIKNMSNSEVEFKLMNLVVSYNIGIKVSGEARLVLEKNDNNTKKIIAGSTIFENDKHDIELGYWVVPEYQNRGIAKAVLKKTTEVVESLSNVENIRLEIQESNIWSSKVAEDCGYELYTKHKGPYDTNLVYLYRRKVGI